MKQLAPASFPARYRVSLLSFADTFPSGIGDVLWALLGAVGLLLLISCANVSNLLFAHSFYRAREMAVRISLGATRRVLIRQLLTESALVSLLGGAVGVALAWAGIKGILAMVPAQTIPDEAEVSLNGPVLAFAIVVSILTTVLFGLLPALQSARKDVVEPLKSGGRAGTTRRESWISGGLVVAEVGLSLMLLMAAALMTRSLISVASAQYGVETAGVLTSRIPMDPRRYAEPERRAAFATQLLDRLKSNPAVQNAAVNTSYHPFGNSSMPVVVPGVSGNRPVTVHSISSDYARVFHIPVRRGRFPDENDVRARRQVAAVSESFVRRYFPGREAVGETFRAPRLSEQPFALASTAFEIVGVVGDTRAYYAKEITPEAYIPFTLSGPANFALVMRPKAGDPKALVPLLRAAIAELDKDQPVMDTQPVDDFIARYVSAGPKFSVVLFGAFGFLGLALVAVGVYGVIGEPDSRTRRTEPGQQSAAVRRPPRPYHGQKEESGRSHDQQNRHDSDSAPAARRS